MKPQYKQVKVIKPHCTICGERLKGNGSIILPYNCLCGVWEWKHRDSDMELELELKKKNYENIQNALTENLKSNQRKTTK